MNHSWGWAMLFFDLLIVAWLLWFSADYVRFKNEYSLRESRVETMLQEAKGLNDITVRYFNAKGYPRIKS